MSEETKISVIVPVYKVETEYIMQCVQSILNQTYTNFEIILVDDNNNQDTSGKLCDRLANQYSKIRTFHQKNQGVSVARNTGLTHSEGKWIAFIDPDDWLETTYFEKLISHGEENKADIVLCSCYANYSNNAQIKNEFFPYKEKYFEGKAKDELFLQLICRGVTDYFPPETGVGVPWAKLYRKQFLIENLLQFDPTLIRMQDNIFNLYAFQAASKIYFFNVCLYHYRKNDASATRKFNPKIIDYFELVNEATLKFIGKYCSSEIFYKAYYAKVLIGFNSYINNYFLPLKSTGTKEYKAIIKEIKELLNKSMYQEALDNVDKSILQNQERLFVAFLKKNQIGLLLLVIQLYQAYRRLKNGSPE